MSETCGRCKRPLWSGEGWPEATFCRFSAGMREECYRVALDAAERHLFAYREAWQACRDALEDCSAECCNWNHMAPEKTRRHDPMCASKARDAALALDPSKAAESKEEWPTGLVDLLLACPVKGFMDGVSVEEWTELLPGVPLWLSAWTPDDAAAPRRWTRYCVVSEYGKPRVLTNVIQAYGTPARYRSGYRDYRRTEWMGQSPTYETLEEAQRGVEEKPWLWAKETTDA